MKDKKQKIVMITSLQPYSNYSRYLCQAFDNNEVELIVYAEDDERNKEVTGCGRVESFWTKDISVFFSILKRLQKDKPDVVHVQYEMNMYGGMLVNAFFPGFLLMLKLFKFKVVFTMHAVVEKKLINHDFVRLFKGDNSNIPPILLIIYFSFFNLVSSMFCDKIIVHTQYLKDALVKDYFVPVGNIEVVPHGVPVMYEKYPPALGNYFFYFGYIARRKGLEHVVSGYADYVKKVQKENALDLYVGGGVIKGQEFALDEFKEMVERLGVADKVKFLGFLEESDIHKYYQNAYCCVMPAVLTISASGPLAMVFGHGKLCLASKIGNFESELRHMETGYLVENSEWEHAFSFVSKNKEFVISSEHNVREQAQERSWPKVAKMHTEIYEGI